MSYEAWGEPEDCPFDAASEAGWLDPTDLSKALIDVMNERDRQWNEEGFSAEWDDAARQPLELARAAMCYVMHPVLVHDLTARMRIEASAESYQTCPPPKGWPFERAWWKPTDPRRDMVKAAALILAEIERLDRAEAKRGATE